MKIECAVYYDRADNNHSVILYGAGRKLIYVVRMGNIIREEKLPKDAQRLFVPALHKGEPYPVRRAARLYLKSSLPKSNRAAKVLRGLVKRSQPQQEVQP